MRQSGLLGRLCHHPLLGNRYNRHSTGFYLWSSPRSSSPPSNLLFMLAEPSRAGAGGPGQVPVSCDSSEQSLTCRALQCPGQSVTKLLPTPTAYSRWRTTSQRAQR